jgi:DNA modification methylase
VEDDMTLIQPRSNGARLAQNSQAALLDRELTPSPAEESGFKDPTFAVNKTLPIHRWVPWIAGFSSQFVKGAIKKYLSSKGTVLDPFAGVGTTLVDAVIGGHDTIGFEINPYPALASRVKANAQKIPPLLLDKQIRSFKAFYDAKENSAYLPKSNAPLGFKTRAAFYSPKVLRKVLIALDFIRNIKDDLLKDVFRLAFASTMVTYSNYSYEPSLGRRVSAGKSDIADFEVGNQIIAKLQDICDDLLWLQVNLKNKKVSAKIINDSFFNCERHIKSGCVDLIVTSPPYLNNYHYNRNTRPQLYWLGLVNDPKDMQPLEESNFGKYWQTVRDGERVNLNFELSDSDLAQRLEEIRSLTPEKGVYGGKGWANYAASYFNDCYRFSQGMKYALAKGSTALVVIGNSILQGIPIATDRYLGQIAEQVGLKLVEIHVPRATRIGNSIIQTGLRTANGDSSQKLYEAVVELRKL